MCSFTAHEGEVLECFPRATANSVCRPRRVHANILRAAGAARQGLREASRGLGTPIISKMSWRCSLFQARADMLVKKGHDSCKRVLYQRVAQVIVKTVSAARYRNQFVFDVMAGQLFGHHH